MYRKTSVQYLKPKYDCYIQILSKLITTEQDTIILSFYAL
jgi:hypothetical protein